MRVIGITGGVGTGKSTVATMFQALGAVVLNADAIAHQTMAPKRIVWREILQTFGREMRNADQTINRRRLAARVFQDASKRRQLERIIHPRVMREIAVALRRLRQRRRGVRMVPPPLRSARGRRLASARPALSRRRGEGMVVLEAPLLLEVGADRLVDDVVVVTADPAVQRQRLRRQHGWSVEEMEARIGAQWALSAKVALADYVINNSGGLAATRRQVTRLWNQLGRPRKSSSTSLR